MRMAQCGMRNADCAFRSRSPECRIGDCRLRICVVDVDALCGSPAQRSAGLQACRLQHDGSMRNRRPRLDRAHYVGLQRYFLTFCTAGRRRRFIQHDVVQMVLEQIAQSAPAFDIVLIAYCFMPDHVHLLIEGCSESADAAAFVGRRSNVDCTCVNVVRSASGCPNNVASPKGACVR